MAKLKEENVGIRILPIEEKYFQGYHDCYDRVAKERKYLAFTEAPLLEVMRIFARNNIISGNPHLVAVDDEKVIGWCYVERAPRMAFAHTGGLEIGLDAAYRGKSLGLELMTRIFEGAKEGKIEKVELCVLESNLRAISLYFKMGFAVEGKLKGKFKIDGRYEDMIVMAAFTSR